MQLINDDCFNVLGEMTDGSVDLIVTDPPYGMDYDPDSRTGKGRFGKIIGDKNLAWLDDFVDEAFRVLKPDSAMFIFCSWHKVDIFKQSLERKFKVKNMLVWVKNVHGLGDLKGSFSPKHELCFYVQKGRVLNRGKRIPDVLNFAKILSKELKHPAEKPVAMLDLMIRNSSDEGDLVLDPFMGSGTTGLACIRGGVDLWVLNSIKAILILQWKGCRMEAVSCATKEDAEKSIRENREDWLIYFWN